MTLFMLNILFALLWTFLWGSFGIYTLVAGFVLGYLLLGLYSRVTQTEGYGNKVVDLLRFAGYFIRILIKANLIIAYDVLTPGFMQKPRFVRYDVTGLTDVQVTTLSNAITLTPGTLVVEISDDRHYLYIHCMYAEDREAAIRDLDELRQRLMKEVFE
jgi:multicomponent Na+:H+ antiporter subunit E